MTYCTKNQPQHVYFMIVHAKKTTYCVINNSNSFPAVIGPHLNFCVCENNDMTHNQSSTKSRCWELTGLIKTDWTWQQIDLDSSKAHSAAVYVA